MMCLSSSWTISCGVMPDIEESLGPKAPRHERKAFATSCLRGEPLIQNFDDDILVRVDANLGRDREALAHDSLGPQRRVLEQGARCRLSVRAARADRDQAMLGLEHVPCAGDHQRAF